MPAGDIQDPTKVRTFVIQETFSDANTALLAFLQARTVGTTIHSVNTIRSKNSQGVSIMIAYEIP